MEPPRGEGQSHPGRIEESTLVSRVREVPEVSFRAFLSGQSLPRVVWAAPDGLELVGGGRAAWLTAAGDDRFDVIKRAAETLFDGVDHHGPTPTRPRLVGGFAFDESKPPGGPWDGFPSAAFVLPAVQLTRWEGSTYLTVNAVDTGDTDTNVEARLAEVGAAVEEMPTMLPAAEPPGVSSTCPRTSRSEWIDMVDSAVARIADGELEKVVLATALDVALDSDIDIPSVLERLRRTHPDCFRFLFQPDDGAGFFGPSPERLVKMSGTTVETEALAGSVPRGETPEEDAAYADSLRESAKLQHEQNLVVRAIRDRLAPLGSVAESPQTVRQLATIQHLRTPLRVELRDRMHVLRLVERLHPTPAVGGVPPGPAIEAIRETERFDRGWYAAPVGWFDAAGNGEFAVAIRSGLGGGHEATLFAGNGIVENSDPAEEWEEIYPKYRPILDELE